MRTGSKKPRWSLTAGVLKKPPCNKTERNRHRFQAVPSLLWWHDGRRPTTIVLAHRICLFFLPIPCNDQSMWAERKPERSGQKIGWAGAELSGHSRKHLSGSGGESGLNRMLKVRSRRWFWRWQRSQVNVFAICILPSVSEKSRPLCFFPA